MYSVCKRSELVWYLVVLSYPWVNFPFRLKKTSCMQSKHRDPHSNWPHYETNDYMSLLNFPILSKADYRCQKLRKQFGLKPHQVAAVRGAEKVVWNTWSWSQLSNVLRRCSTHHLKTDLFKGFNSVAFFQASLSKTCWKRKWSSHQAYYELSGSLDWEDCCDSLKVQKVFVDCCLLWWNHCPDWSILLCCWAWLYSYTPLLVCHRSVMSKRATALRTWWILKRLETPCFCYFGLEQPRVGTPSLIHSWYLNPTVTRIWIMADPMETVEIAFLLCFSSLVTFWLFSW